MNRRSQFRIPNLPVALVLALAAAACTRSGSSTPSGALGLGSVGTWVRSYGAGPEGPSVHWIPTDAAALPGGGFALTGYVEHADGDRDMWIARMAEDGSPLWSRVLGRAAGHGLATVTAAAATRGGVLLGGADTRGVASVVRLDGGGGLQSRATLPRMERVDVLEPRGAGGFLVAGPNPAGTLSIAHLDDGGRVVGEVDPASSGAVERVAGAVAGWSGGMILVGQRGPTTGFILGLNDLGAVEQVWNGIGYLYEDVTRGQTAGDYVTVGLHDEQWFIHRFRDGTTLGPERGDLQSVAPGTRALAVEATSDGGYLVGGTGGWMLSYRADLVRLWQRAAVPGRAGEDALTIRSIQARNPAEPSDRDPYFLGMSGYGYQAFDEAAQLAPALLVDPTPGSAPFVSLIVLDTNGDDVLTEGYLGVGADGVVTLFEEGSFEPAWRVPPAAMEGDPDARDEGTAVLDTPWGICFAGRSGPDGLLLFTDLDGNPTADVRVEGVAPQALELWSGGVVVAGTEGVVPETRGWFAAIEVLPGTGAAAADLRVPWQRLYEAPLPVHRLALLRAADGTLRFAGLLTRIDESDDIIWTGRKDEATGEHVAGAERLWWSDSGHQGKFLRLAPSGPDHWFLLQQGGGLEEHDAQRALRVARFRGDDTLEWWKPIRTGRDAPLRAVDLGAAPDDGCMVALTTLDSTDSADILGVRITRSGTECWHEAYGTGVAERVHLVLHMPSGGYLIGGRSEGFHFPSTDAFLVRTGARGDVSPGCPAILPHVPWALVDDPKLDDGEGWGPWPESGYAEHLPRERPDVPAVRRVGLAPRDYDPEVGRSCAGRGTDEEPCIEEEPLPEPDCPDLEVPAGSFLFQGAVHVSLPDVTGNNLVDGSFETSTPRVPFPPTAFGPWQGDVVAVVDASDPDASAAGIVVPHGSRMLKFVATSAGGGTPVGLGSELFQLYPVAAASGDVIAQASMLVNRVRGDAQTDTVFELTVYAFDGEIVQLNQKWLAQGWLASRKHTLASDACPETWEILRTQLLLPPETTYVMITITAVEDVYNEPNEGDREFDGHFADRVSLVVGPR